MADAIMINGGMTLPEGIGCVDLGTLNWGYLQSPNRFSASFADIKYSSVSKQIDAVNALYDVYSFSSAIGSAINMSIFAWGNTTKSTNINVMDDRYTDAASFKSAMSGVLLFYKKAE